MHWTAGLSPTALLTPGGVLPCAVAIAVAGPFSLAAWRARLLARFPHRQRTLHSHHVLQFQFGECIAKFTVDTVGGIGQHHTARYICLYRSTNLIQSNL